jgi:hypothetical protein
MENINIYNKNFYRKTQCHRKNMTGSFAHAYENLTLYAKKHPELFRQFHFFRLAQQCGIDRYFSAVAAAVTFVIDPVPAVFRRGKVL